MRIKKLPHTCWDINAYHADLYGYGHVDIFIDECRSIGERVICIFRRKDLLKYNDKYCYDKTIAILCNDCGINSNIYDLLHLNAGQIIPVQFNGTELPIVPLNWIELKFWTIQ